MSIVIYTMKCVLFSHFHSTKMWILRALCDVPKIENSTGNLGQTYINVYKLQCSLPMNISVMHALYTSQVLFKFSLFSFLYHLLIIHNFATTHLLFGQACIHTSICKYLNQSEAKNILSRVWPDIRQCRNIWPDIRLSGKEKPDIRQGMLDNPVEYPASGKKNQIRPNPNLEMRTWVLLCPAAGRPWRTHWRPASRSPSTSDTGLSSPETTSHTQTLFDIEIINMI